MGGKCNIDLLSSMNTHLIMCDQCERTFETEAAYGQHHQDRHSTEPQRLQCVNGCKRWFGSEHALNKHREDKHPNGVDEFLRATSKIIIPQKEFPFSCADCRLDYETLDDLHEHQTETACEKRDGSHIYLTREPGSRACEACAEEFDSHDSLEQHFVSEHAVIPMEKHEKKRKEQEKMFIARWSKAGQGDIRIQSVFRIHSSAWKSARYEKCKREMEARGIPQGNEMLSYHGTSVACDLGSETQGAKLCNNSKERRCNMCSILLRGFLPSKAAFDKFQRFGRGIYSTPYSGKSNDYIPSDANRRAVLVCKVLTGRQFETQKNLPQLTAPPPGYDSIWGKPGQDLNYDEYVVYNPRLIIPAYIITYTREPPVPHPNVRKGSNRISVKESLYLVRRTSGGSHRSRMYSLPSSDDDTLSSLAFALLDRPLNLAWYVNELAGGNNTSNGRWD